MINKTKIDHKNPKSLFKFSKISEYTYSSLINKTIFVAKANSLNDPFELDIDFDENISDADILILNESYPDADFSTLPKLISEAKISLENMLEMTRLMSLTSNPFEILMWSHYADEHKGICIEYDRQHCEILSDPQICQKVIYPDASHKTKIKILPLLLGGPLTKNIIETIIYARKSPQWKYENEWRLIVESTNELGNIQLINNTLKIKSIIFGIRTPDHHKHAIYELVNNLYENQISFYQAEKMTNALEISIVEFSPEKHIKPFMAPALT